MITISFTNKPPIVYHLDEKLDIVKNEQYFGERELEIMKCLAQQMSSKEIADKLFISSHTVDTHRRNLLDKTNTKDSNSLITYAKMVGWL